MKNLRSHILRRMPAALLIIGLGLLSTSAQSNPNSREVLKAGTVTWNDEAIVEFSEAGVVTYAFKLHVRLDIDPTLLRDYVKKLSDPNIGPTKGDIADIIALHSFKKGEKIVAKYRDSNTNPVGWSFRVYYDGNEDSTQRGSFVELEFSQRLKDNGDRSLIHDYIATKKPGAAKDKLRAANLITDSAAVAILDLDTP